MIVRNTLFALMFTIVTVGFAVNDASKPLVTTQSHVPLPTPTKPSNNLNDGLVVPGKSIGRVQLAELLEDVYNDYPYRKEYDAIHTNGIFKSDGRVIECADVFHRLPFPDDVDLFVYTINGRVVQVEAASPRYYLPNGVKEDETFSEVLKKFPESKLFILRGSGGEHVGGKDFVYLVDESTGLALEFRLSRAKKTRTVSKFIIFPSRGHFEPETCVTPPQTYERISVMQLGIDSVSNYPAVWFSPINDPNKPEWEILPRERQAGEVILSKRNELGILSNFAPTPFELYGKRYGSVEGFWQMMLYPEGPNDERAKDKRVTWKYTREQVAQMTAFEAKSAGTLAEENMKKLGIDWCTFDGKRFPYRSATPGEHYRLIVDAMRAKLDQNSEVKRILLATDDLILKPDHHGEADPPPEWKYYEIWMQIRTELQKPARK